VTNAINPSADPAPSAFPYEGLLKPERLMDSLEVHARRSATERDRSVELIAATPGEELHPDLPRGADRYDITFDSELDLIRRITASRDGDEFEWIEIDDLTEDPVLPPETFVIDLPSGVEFKPPPPPSNRPRVPPSPPFAPPS
jgi:outer membrane lipoprotein-sorting protein